jgi:hypothetical protein
MFEGQCIGVPPGDLCDDDFCTDGVPCSEVIELEDGDDLAAAAAGAPPGSCIALGEGSYGAATIPGSVSVLGKSVGRVTVGALGLDPGSGTVIRGVRIQGGVAIHEAAVRIEATRIEGGVDGIITSGAAELTLADSEIEGVSRHGVLALQARSVRVERALLKNLGGPAVWVQCGTGCDCAEKPNVTLDHVLVEKTRHVGVSLIGAQAELHTVRIFDTRQVTEPNHLEGGGGFVASGCSVIDVVRLTVDTAVSFGVLVDGASGNLGNDAEEKGIIIVGTKVGIWLSNIQEGIRLSGVDVDANRGVGIGIGGTVASKGIIIVGTKVGRTEMASLLDVDETTKEVGHGLVWDSGAEVQIDGLTLAGNALASLLIDGPVGTNSKLKDVVLTDGDEAKGIVQQNVMAADAAPAEEGSTPTVTRAATKVAEVPAGPQAPQALE